MREISITTDKRLFTRVPPAKEKVLQAMRNDLMKMYPEEEYDWSTEVLILKSLGIVDADVMIK